MSSLIVSILLILFLIVINGIFALAEIAVISSRRARLQQRADMGNHGARTALDLISEPTRFLSTVQIGITLVGILAGAFGEAMIAEYVRSALDRVPILAPYAYAISLGLVVLVITFLTLVVGELLPKQIALSNPEGIASWIARLMHLLSVLFAPIVYILSASTGLLIRLFGIGPPKTLPVTPEEISILLEQGERAGVFEPTEQDIIESALRLDDLRVSALITPRMEIDWLDIDEPYEDIMETVMTSRHSSFPVAHENLDNIAGVVQGRDVLIRQVTAPPAELITLMKPPVFVPESQSALEMLEMFKGSGQHMALVIDEYGGLLGLVTLTDIVEALVGEIRSPGLAGEAEAVRLEGGEWLLDGRLPMQEFMDLLDIRELPEGAETGHDTLGGFVMDMLGRIPARGDSFESGCRRFEVVSMEGKRVSQVKVTPLPCLEPEDTDE